MTTSRSIAPTTSILAVSLMLVGSTGCSTLSNLVGGSSSSGSQTTPSSGGAGSGATGSGGAGCEGTLVEIRAAFDEDIAKLKATPPTNRASVKQQQTSVRNYQNQAMGMVHQYVDCSNQPEVSAHIASESGKMNASFARALLKAGDPLSARGALMTEYKRDDKVDKPEYRQLSKEIAASYDQQRLALYRSTGKLGDNGKAQKSCLFSDKPFPKQPSVSPIFKTHLETSTVYVMCHLPKAASSYQVNVEPTMKISMGINTGNSTFPLDEVKLGSPSQLGNTQYVFGQFSVPPSRKDFQGVKRLALQVSLQHHYKVRVRGILDPRRVNVAEASFFWHQP